MRRCEAEEEAEACRRAGYLTIVEAAAHIGLCRCLLEGALQGRTRYAPLFARVRVMRGQNNRIYLNPHAVEDVRRALRDWREAA